MRWKASLPTSTGSSTWRARKWRGCVTSGRRWWMRSGTWRGSDDEGEYFTAVGRTTTDLARLLEARWRCSDDALLRQRRHHVHRAGWARKQSASAARPRLQAANILLLRGVRSRRNQ